MIAGFVVLGACSVAFGGSLHRALGGSERSAVSPGRARLGTRAGERTLRRVHPRRLPDPGPRRAGLGPRLIQWAGVLTIAAGLLRRDHMMLGLPGESWHNHAHDVVSSIIYLTLVVAPLLLAARFRGDASWQRLSVPLVAGSAATAGALAVFVSLGLRVVGPGPAAGGCNHSAGHAGRRRRPADHRGTCRGWLARRRARPAHASRVRNSRQDGAIKMPGGTMKVTARVRPVNDTDAPETQKGPSISCMEGAGPHCVHRRRRSPSTDTRCRGTPGVQPG